MKAMVLGSVLVLFLAGCTGAADGGSDGGGMSSSSVACHAAFDSVLEKVQDLDSRLSIGMALADYANALGEAKIEYDRIDVSPDSDCVLRVGAPLETALRKYIGAERLWNRCVVHAVSGCSIHEIKPKLQGAWQVASRSIRVANDQLNTFT